MWASLAGAQISPCYGAPEVGILGNMFECVVTSCLESEPRDYRWRWHQHWDLREHLHWHRHYCTSDILGDVSSAAAATHEEIVGVGERPAVRAL